MAISAALDPGSRAWKAGTQNEPHGHSMILGVTRCELCQPENMIALPMFASFLAENREGL